MIHPACLLEVADERGAVLHQVLLRLLAHQRRFYGGAGGLAQAAVLGLQGRQLRLRIAEALLQCTLVRLLLRQLLLGGCLLRLLRVDARVGV